MASVREPCEGSQHFIENGCSLYRVRLSSAFFPKNHISKAVKIKKFLFTQILSASFLMIYVLSSFVMQAVHYQRTVRPMTSLCMGLCSKTVKTY